MPPKILSFDDDDDGDDIVSAAHTKAVSVNSAKQKPKPKFKFKKRQLTQPTPAVPAEQTQSPSPSQTKATASIGDLMDKYGSNRANSDRIIAKPHTIADSNEEAEGFFLSASDSNDDDDNLEADDPGQEHASQTPTGDGQFVRDAELRMLNEEFIPQDLESTKRTRQVLERDTESMLLDYGAPHDDEETASDKHQLVEQALSNASNGSSDDHYVIFEDPGVVLVTKPILSAAEAEKLLRTRLQQSLALKETQQAKLDKFHNEMSHLAIS